uniref:Uncharacterized protein n=1 Tax=Leersia perrieri TaxID=77586 RepID=A0A0D9VAP6_9ORYZ
MSNSENSPHASTSALSTRSVPFSVSDRRRPSRSPPATRFRGTRSGADRPLLQATSLSALGRNCRRAMGSKDSEVTASLDGNKEDEEDGTVILDLLLSIYGVGFVTIWVEETVTCVLALVHADWEAIADRGEHDETLALAQSLEQKVEVSPCTSSEKISTPSTSTGPKRRGRGSFLYDKSVLYSDQCGLENDVDEEESNDQNGSKGRVDEQKHKISAGMVRGSISMCPVIVHGE